MPDVDRKQLSGGQARGSPGVHGWAAILVGLLFVGGGASPFLIAVGVVHVPQSSVHAPYWVLGAAGIAFLAVGGYLMVGGTRGLLRARRAEWIRLSNPAEPWMADHPWDPSGTRDDTPRRIVREFVGALFLVVFLSIFNWWAFASGENSLLLAIVVLALDGAAVAVLGHAAYLLIRLLKCGRAYLRFARFPFFLGETLDLSFAGGRNVGSLEQIVFTLRFVQEACERSGKSERIVRYQSYCDQIVVDGTGGLRAEDPEREISFPLPTGDYETRLRAQPPQYWELEVTAKTRGVDYAATFLVPVYAKP